MFTFTAFTTMLTLILASIGFLTVTAITIALAVSLIKRTRAKKRLESLLTKKGV